jgi:hypothetical protein
LKGILKAKRGFEESNEVAEYDSKEQKDQKQIIQRQIRELSRLNFIQVEFSK